MQQSALFDNDTAHSAYDLEAEINHAIATTPDTELSPQGIAKKLQLVNGEERFKASATKTVNDKIADYYSDLCMWNPEAFRNGEVQPTKPTVLQHDDGQGLFYESHLNSIYGQSGCGKTWICLAAITETLTRSSTTKAAYIDLDGNTPNALALRLHDVLQLDMAIICDTERYQCFSPKIAAQIKKVIQHLQTWKPDIVVLDCMSRLCNKLNCDPNTEQGVTTAVEILTPLCVEGTTVIIIDHVNKNPDNRNGASGSQAKLSTITGAAYLVQVVKPLQENQGGKLSLTNQKDRHGGVPVGDPTATFTLYNEGGWCVARATEKDTMPARLWKEETAQAILTCDPFPQSTKECRERGISGKQDVLSASLTEAKRRKSEPETQGTSTTKTG